MNAPRGYFWFEDADSGHAFWWPYCEIDGCENGICFRLSETRCYVHAANDPAIKEMLRDVLDSVKEPALS